MRLFLSTTVLYSCTVSKRLINSTDSPTDGAPSELGGQNVPTKFVLMQGTNSFTARHPFRQRNLFRNKHNHKRGRGRK